MTRLAQRYKNEIIPSMMKKFGYKNVMQVPKVQKITINMGVGEAVNDKKVMNFAVEDMTRISGQKPVVTLARKSIAGFKIREGWPVGCKVTLRNKCMYEFLERLISVALPRVRDFRGLNPKSFDKQGNYNMGLSEQIVFPEIDFDKIDVVRGMDISITTTARNSDEARFLLTSFDFPLKGIDK